MLNALSGRQLPLRVAAASQLFNASAC
jgi:hypothetical protein